MDPVSRQFVQRVKCYQTIVSLGTYTAKVPVYNSLKACKGTMFFLPLPLNKTLETLDQVEASSDALPDPELHIIVNGRPTKSKVVWRSLVDVNRGCKPCKGSHTQRRSKMFWDREAGGQQWPCAALKKSAMHAHNGGLGACPPENFGFQAL